MLGYWPYATHKKTFFLKKTTSITIKYKNRNKRKPIVTYILKFTRKVKATKKKITGEK